VTSPAALQAAFVDMVKRLCEALGHAPTRPEPLLDLKDLA
jgi:hypothetical protein